MTHIPSVPESQAACLIGCFLQKTLIRTSNIPLIEPFSLSLLFLFPSLSPPICDSCLLPRFLFPFSFSLSPSHLAPLLSHTFSLLFPFLSLSLSFLFTFLLSFTLTFYIS